MSKLRVRTDDSIVVDVRIVATTDRPIEALVAQGQLRHDLHARLCGHVMGLPPLHARIEDLGLLWGSIAGSTGSGTAHAGRLWYGEGMRFAHAGFT